MKYIKVHGGHLLSTGLLLPKFNLVLYECDELMTLGHSFQKTSLLNSCPDDIATFQAQD